MTPQEVGDEMSRGLHMIKHFEKEMNHHPFGHKLIVIGKPMMMNGLHNAMGMMDPEVMHHMCHHHGHHHCKHIVNNIVKCIILFLIWKIFESIDNRCCGMCESECIKKFKNDLSECYDRIGKMNILLNESCLGLSEESRIAMKIKGIEVVEMFMQAEIYNKSNKKLISEAVANPLANPLLRQIVSAANAHGYKVYDPTSTVPRLNMNKSNNIYAAANDPKFRRTLLNMGITAQQFNQILIQLRKPIATTAGRNIAVGRNVTSMF